MNNDIQQIAEAYLYRGEMQKTPRELAADKQSHPPFESVNKGQIPENFADAANQIAKYFGLPLDDKTWGALLSMWHASRFFQED